MIRGMRVADGWCADGFSLKGKMRELVLTHDSLIPAIDPRDHFFHGQQAFLYLALWALHGSIVTLRHIAQPKHQQFRHCGRAHQRRSWGDLFVFQGLLLRQDPIAPNYALSAPVDTSFGSKVKHCSLENRQQLWIAVESASRLRSR